MKFFRVFATCVASWVAFANLSPAQAQETTGPATAATAARPSSPALQYGIRVIDVKRVFDDYWYFKDNIKVLREKVNAFTEEQKGQQKLILDEEKKLPELQPGTEDRRALEKKIYQMKADLAAQANLKQKEFMEAEAKIYYNTYKILEEEVAYYCKVKGVAVVVSYNSEKADPNNRQSIMRAMTNTVVASDPAVDITDTILRVLNRGKQSPPAAKIETSRNGGGAQR